MKTRLLVIETLVVIDRSKVLALLIGQRSLLCDNDQSICGTVLSGDPLSFCG